jgi:hypothetical protein
MSNEMYTQLPSVTFSTMADIICAVSGGSAGVSSQETLGQVFDLFLAGAVLNYAGNPNGNLAGDVYQFCWDTTNHILYVCTTSGNAASAVWTLAGGTVLPVPATQGGTGVTSPTAHTLPVAEGASAFTFLGPLTNGQLLIGSTGANPVPAGITAGPGISITNGAGSLTVSGTGSGIGWTDVTGTTQAIVADSGYVADNVGLVTLTLPATAAFGTAISIIGKGAGGWLIAQRAGQNIQMGNVSSTVGVGGSVASTNAFDSLNLICTTANTTWTLTGGPQGNLTIV